MYKVAHTCSITIRHFYMQDASTRLDFQVMVQYLNTTFMHEFMYAVDYKDIFLTP